MNLILLQITSLIYIVLLNIFYFSKKHISNLENKIVEYLMVLNMLGLSIELVCFYTVSHMNVFPVINTIFTKLLLVYYLLFISIYTYYVFVIAYKHEKQEKKQLSFFLKKVKTVCLIGFILSSLLVSSLPMQYYNDTKYVYSYGLSVDCLALIFILVLSIWSIVLIRKYKNIKVYKYMPIITFILLAGVGGIVQKIYPHMLLTTPIETLIIFLMYFTIENPDMKLLDEVHKSKEISDNANEEKTLFLYNLTQEVRKTTSEINNSADLILDSNSLEENKDYARDIKATTSKFITMTNDILDVSKIDSANIKVYNSKYKIKNIIKQIVNIYSDTCKNKEITFRTNIDHDIPEVLYGDSIGLKEVLTIILNNSCKYTEKGFIEFNVNTIIKNDICRLIITIEDSGIGIKSEDINKVKIDNKSLSKANKLITLMNGTMMISSNYGMGTKVKIILDQKIELETDNESSKYEEVFDEKKILMIDDNEASFRIIDKLLKGSNIIIDNCNNGKEAINKIKSKNKYDVILLDEELSQISGSELLKKLKEIRNFNIPVILLTKDNNYEYNEEYLKLGFVDYILKPIKKETLLEKINKYGK